MVFIVKREVADYRSNKEKGEKPLREDDEIGPFESSDRL